MEMEVIDQLGSLLHFHKTPERIISLVPSQTELLVDLGLENKLVGITKFCVHPTYLLATKTIVGGTKKVNFDKIKALQPDIIICNKEENTEEMVLALRDIAPVWVSDIVAIEGNNQMIKSLGTLFQVSERASEIIKVIADELTDFQKFIATKPIRKAAYLIWKNPYMAVGGNTFIDYLMTLNNFENIFQTKKSRYPEIKSSELEEAQVVLLSTEPFPFKENDVLELQQTFGKEVCLVDGEYFSWYGSRLQYAFAYFKTLH